MSDSEDGFRNCPHVRYAWVNELTGNGIASRNSYSFNSVSQAGVLVCRCHACGLERRFRYTSKMERAMILKQYNITGAPARA